MALDTKQKRSSAIGINLPFVVLFPDPDGAVSQADRQDVGYSYAGILAAGAVIGQISRILLAYESAAVFTLVPLQVGNGGWVYDIVQGYDVAIDYDLAFNRTLVTSYPASGTLTAEVEV